ncbi:thiol reductant ABC exporter subunit CydC [Mumia sp. ZJ1417]|uniref:thiol reductant ABC exporter subunit CydC n=1 Tax=Mumia sp. ZJ1417 TaxID=2708082 RepID=UPI001420085B|nr:thiol reductant ABC exporter subunit CydC [Mumia sp. ZJ1417]QMW65119.1 thiol reductant ABC exporter subunit CydC [Mumia sp. ZJ1417]
MTTARRRLVLGGFFGLLASLASIGLLLVSAWLISRAAQHPPVLYLMLAIVAVRAFGVARAALRYVERLFTHDGALRIGTQIRLAVYEGLERLSPSTLAAGRRGERISRIVSDVEALQDRIVRVAIPRVVTALSAAVVVGLVLAVFPLGGAILAAAVLVAWCGVLVAVRLGGDQTNAATADLRGALAAEVSQTVRSARDLVAYGAADQARDEVARTGDHLASTERRTAFLDGLGVLLVRVCLGAATCAIAWTGVAAAADGALSPVLLAVVVLAPVALAEPLEGLSGIEQQDLRSAASRRRVDELVSAPEDVVDPVDPAADPVGFDLHLRDVALGWGDAPDLVRGLDLDLPEGAVVAVAGPSGSGKSTLAAVLLRLAAPRAGTITLGGTPIDTLTGEQVRRVVATLRQDEHVFDTTIRENLRIADPDADDATLRAALDAAGLGLFVAGLPDGLDTEVGENGNRLSGGERQRLGLARLLLGDHRVLVLDEPTEHLDAATAEALLRDLVALAPYRSILLVSHDERALAAASHVVRLGAATRIVDRV